MAQVLDIKGKLVDMRTTDPRLSSLRAIRILRQLPGRRLRRFAPHLDEVHIDAGVTLIHQDQLNRHAYFVASGSLRVDVDGQRVATVAAGSVVGERTALVHGPANATVTAIEPTVVFVADHRALLAAASTDTDFAAELRELADGRSRPVAA